MQICCKQKFRDFEVSHHFQWGSAHCQWKLPVSHGMSIGSVDWDGTSRNSARNGVETEQLKTEKADVPNFQQKRAGTNHQTARKSLFSLQHYAYPALFQCLTWLLSFSRNVPTNAIDKMNTENPFKTKPLKPAGATSQCHSSKYVVQLDINIYIYIYIYIYF